MKREKLWDYNLQAPSFRWGLLTKANWLLEQSKRNQNKVHELVVTRILMTDYKMWKSWLTAENIAVAVIRFNLNKAQDVRNLGFGNKEK